MFILQSAAPTSQKSWAGDTPQKFQQIIIDNNLHLFTMDAAFKIAVKPANDPNCQFCVCQKTGSNSRPRSWQHRRS